MASPQGSDSALQVLSRRVLWGLCVCVCACVCSREQGWRERKAIDKPRELLGRGSAEGKRQARLGLEEG